MRPRRACGGHGSVEVDGKTALELLLGDRLDRAARAQPGIIDDNIDASDDDIKVSELRHMHSEMIEAGASKWATLSVDGSSSGNILSLSDISLVLTSGFRNPLS